MTKACKGGLDVNPFGWEVLHVQSMEELALLEPAGTATSLCAVTLTWTSEQMAGNKPLFGSSP